MKPEEPDKSSVSRETHAMRDVADALAPLTPEERNRVLAWARRFSGPAMRAEGPGGGS